MIDLSSFSNWTRASPLRYCSVKYDLENTRSTSCSDNQLFFFCMSRERSSSYLVFGHSSAPRVLRLFLRFKQLFVRGRVKHLPPPHPGILGRAPVVLLEQLLDA